MRTRDLAGICRFLPLLTLAASALACGGRQWVSVVDSEPAERAWQLTYRNDHDRPVSCRANVHFVSERSADDLDYGYREAAFTIDAGGDRVVDYVEPDVDAPPGSLGGYGYRVLYLPGQGAEEGLYLECREAE